MKIGILRETKTPPDKRVALTPGICKSLKEKYPELDIVVQPDEYRAFTNEEYRAKGIEVSEDVTDCDVLFGVKEVKKEYLIPEKTYFFFSHTAKKQPYNRDLLREILQKKIRLVDYEYLTDEDNIRIVAFGRWAGIVGSYNGLRGWGLLTAKYDLKPAWKCRNKKELLNELSKVKLNKIKILVTGGGRVAGGAMEIIEAAGVIKADPLSYLKDSFPHPVYSQLDPQYYVERIDGEEFSLQHFFSNPQVYKSGFQPYTEVTDLYIACHFWDPNSPVFFTKEDMQNENFKIRFIADVSCDIDGPIPSTIRASTIGKPFYDYDLIEKTETEAFSGKGITVMAVDNLPGELPRDASEDFGKNLFEKVFPYLLEKKRSNVIEKAVIAENGRLSRRFSYLEDYIKGLE